MATYARSLLKTITWRIIAIIILGATSSLLTGNTIQSLGITVIFNNIQIVLYFLHERVWNGLDWGRK